VYIGWKWVRHNTSDWPILSLVFYPDWQLLSFPPPHFLVLFSFVPTVERALYRRALYQIEGGLLTYAPEIHLSALFWLWKEKTLFRLLLRGASVNISKL
jgi:hypothetical protein